MAEAKLKFMFGPGQIIISEEYLLYTVMLISGIYFERCTFLLYVTIINISKNLLEEAVTVSCPQLLHFPKY